MPEITPSQFDLYQLVTLRWNSQERPTKVVRRFFDPDDGNDGSWYYSLSVSEKPYPETVIEPRDD